MNVDDVKSLDIEVDDRLVFIFNKQRSLMHKYEGIEASNGLLQTDKVPVDINNNKGQSRLKDFAWRVTEELMESLEAFRIHPELELHYKEEIADAFHFLVELAILSDIEPVHMIPNEDSPADIGMDILGRMFNIPLFETEKSMSFEESMVEVILTIGQAMNLLKNKPWKQTHMMTDVPRYRDFIIKTFHNFANMCMYADMDADDLFDLYFRKSEVNKFRQESNY